MLRSNLIPVSVAVTLSFCTGVSVQAGEKSHIILEEHQVFQSGTEGYQSVRVPAVITAPNGDLLAFCEGRLDAFNLDRSNKDIIMKRSTDHGRTWSALQVIVDHTRYFSRFVGRRVSAGNMAPVVDTDTNTIWLHFSIDGSYEPAATDHNITPWVISSTDNGATWSDPVELTDSVKLPEWDELFHGPGHAIQLAGGRLLIPGYHSLRSPPPDRPQPYSHVLYSDDHGTTWHIGGTVGYDTNEATAVQLADGRVLINMRSSESLERKIAISEDDGKTWGPIRYDSQLIGAICQASIIRYTRERRHDGNRLLFSNPAMPANVRENLSIKVSYDEGSTWSEGKTIYAGSSAYSDLVILDDLTIGILYERDFSSAIVFARFNLDWLTDGEDTVGKRYPPPRLYRRGASSNLEGER
jgi:sialidase-1